jgi:hypothetical protein
LTKLWVRAQFSFRSLFLLSISSLYIIPSGYTSPTYSLSSPPFLWTDLATSPHHPYPLTDLTFGMPFQPPAQKVVSHSFTSSLLFTTSSKAHLQRPKIATPKGKQKQPVKQNQASKQTQDTRTQSSERQTQSQSQSTSQRVTVGNDHAQSIQAVRELVTNVVSSLFYLRYIPLPMSPFGARC